MSNSMTRPVSPMFVCPTLSMGCDKCKDGVCRPHGVEEEIGVDDIDRGNYIVGPYDDGDSPVPMKSPREMTPA